MTCLDPLGMFDTAACRICGCTDMNACELGCWWVEDPAGDGPLCSSCVELAVALDAILTALGEVDEPLTAPQLQERTGIVRQHRVIGALVDLGHLQAVEGGRYAAVVRETTC